MELTLDQKKALARARARIRIKQTATEPQKAPNLVTQPDMGGIPLFGPLLRLAGYDGLPKEAQEGYTPGPVPALDPVNAFASKAMESVPVLGPMIKGGMNNLAASVHGITPEEIEAQNVATESQYPNAAVAGQVAGTVGPLAGVGATATGARLLGQVGGLVPRMITGSASAAAITGTDSLARGKPFEEALDDAKWAAMIGGGLPVAERLAGVVIRAMTGKALDPAETALARAIQDDGIPLDQLQQRINELGPDAVLADLGPNLQRQAGALASLPGQAQKTVRTALGERAQSTNTRIIGDVNDTLGPAPVPSRVTAEIQQNMDALGPEYQAALGNARAVNTDALALDLDSQIVNLRGDAQKAVRQVRSMLDVEGVPGQLDPNPATLFQVRQAIDGLLETEANTKVIGALTRARQQVDTILADAAPGIKQVDAKFEELARQRDALGQGQQVLDSGRTAIRPEELEALIAESAVPARGIGPSAVPYRLSQGTRAEIERIIGTTTNDLNALKTALKGDGSWNRDRLVTLFGKDKADRLLHILDREKAFDATNRIVTQNSETAARTAAQDEVSPMRAGKLSGLTWTGLLATGGQKLANIGAASRRTGTNATIADALMSNQISPARLQSISEALQQISGRSKILPPAAIAQALLGNN